MLYVVLPDGSILSVKEPADYVLAAEIAKDEAGDVLSSAFASAALLSTSCREE